MGAAVSAWQLARAVSLTGQLGVVSGTAIDVVLARRLQQGDSGGHVRRALEDFPFPEMAERIVNRYFVPGGKSANTSFLPERVLPVKPTQEQQELVVVANFVEVFLAKEGHDGHVGINYLEKIQTPTLPSLFGAMLAGVDYVLMGAGIPRAIPGVLDRLANGSPVELPLNVEGAGRDDHFVTCFDPMTFSGGAIPWLERPKFLAIVASASLASLLARKSSGRVDGFIVEGPTAGGHNAPPRGKGSLNERGEPVYGAKDEIDLDAMRALGVPFWLAGSYGSAERIDAALQAGASGVQVGTAFAFCNESGFRSDIKQRVLEMCRDGSLDVVTDPLASPTGFPFKVLQLEDSLSEDSINQQRHRICDLGFLRQAYRKTNGSVGWRCPGEPVAAYVHKGGVIDETVGRKCVCNGLLANVGLGQCRGDGNSERPLVTCGNDLASITRFLKTPDAESYSAADVVESLLAGVSIGASL
ncbi:MAG: nitronate monooxygenase [Fuerstiella sp.]|nr:nitronate monooxygenase [Fuerstiella sp.]MCP4858984.1 nitronate monooxygenase [Fuerstiella sp.]